ncbi:MAG TPA: hypothetical protein VFF52_00670, partial [Isosphaeraceae bacterium]|nr:hypothetical protein [Isosphaeraceae bacterium]
AFGDLVFAQQNLTTNVTAYIGILGSLWSSVVSVADFLQTDDLFQLKKRHELPELPDFTQVPHWACDHASVAASCPHGEGGSGWSAAAPGTGSPPSGPAGSEMGPPSPAGGDCASAPRSPGGPPAANPTVRPPAPPSGSEGDATAQLHRGRDPDLSPVALLKSYLGTEVDRAGQAFFNAMAPVKAYFRKVGDQVGPALRGPAAPVRSDSGEEAKDDGRNS